MHKKVSTEELITGANKTDYFMASGKISWSLPVGASAALRLHPHCKPCPNPDGATFTRFLTVF